MRRIITLLLCAAALFALASCGSQKQEDLLNYLNVQMANLESAETEILDSYEAVTGENYTDDYDLYNALYDTIIPKAQKFITDIEAIRPADAELREIHELYIAAWNSQYGAFTETLAALENQDMVLITSANEKLDKARKGFRDYQSAIADYAKRNNVEMK